MVLNLSENSSDDLYGKLAVRGTDVIKRQLQIAYRQALALQTELDKIDVNIVDDRFKDTTESTLTVTEEEPEPIEITPDITVVDDDTEISIATTETLFEQEEADIDVKTLIDPVLKTPFEPRTLMQEDMDEDFDPSRPEFGKIIGMTEQLRERIRQYYYDRGGGSYEMVFYLTPDEFLNLASLMQGAPEDQQVIDELQEKIFPKEGEDDFDFDPLQLHYNITRQEITGHEGRHRSFAVLQEQQKRGEEPIKLPVRITFQTDWSDLMGLYSRGERPDEIPIVPLIKDKIKQQFQGADRVRELAGAIPQVSPETTFVEYAKAIGEYNERLKEAKKTYQEERFQRQTRDNEVKATARDMVTGVLDEVHDKVNEKIENLKIPRDIDYAGTLYDATEIGGIMTMEDNIVNLGDYYKYDVDKKQLIIQEAIKNIIKPENMKLLIESALKDVDIPFEIVVPDYDPDDIKRDDDINLTVGEEDELVDNVVNMFNSIVEEANSSGNSHTGSINTRIKRILLQREIERQLEEE